MIPKPAEVLQAVQTLQYHLGAGKWSLDKALDYPIAPYSAAAFWITLVLGVGSALGLLAIFWRPEKKDVKA